MSVGYNVGFAKGWSLVRAIGRHHDGGGYVVGHDGENPLHDGLVLRLGFDDGEGAVGGRYGYGCKGSLVSHQWRQQNVLNPVPGIRVYAAMRRINPSSHGVTDFPYIMRRV